MGYAQEYIKPYHTNGRKKDQVEQMFNNIAPAYDPLNHILSLGIDRSWRRKAIRWLQTFRPATILDIATGTGDFAILAGKYIRPKKILAIDISEEMMKIGQQKVAKAKLDTIISFKKEDCAALSSLPNESFDAVTVAFGIRNFEDLDRSLTEIHRVLRTGGHMAILEFSSPISFPVKQLFAVYSRIILPTVGRLISKDNSAYAYLPETIRAFPQGEVMQGILLKTGFKDVKFKRFTAGICTLYMVTK